MDINLHLPDSQGQPNVTQAIPQTTVQSDTSVINTIINLGNKYLWFALGIVAMVMVVYAGIQLVTARGDKKAMSKATGILYDIIIGLLIAIFAYVLVRLVVNLF